MEPREDQSQRSDNQSAPPPRSNGFSVPVNRRPPLSRGVPPRSFARQPTSAVGPLDQQLSSQSQIDSVPPQTTPVEPLAQQPIESAAPNPVIQMPQPATFASPLTPEQTVVPSMPQSSPEPTMGRQLGEGQSPPFDFTPPPQKKNFRRLLKPALAVVVVLVLGIGIFSYTKVLAARNNPDAVMKNALNNSLSLTTVQSTTKSTDRKITTQYDFTDSKNPVVDVASSVTSPKGQTMINGYGDIKNTYLNYASLPKSVTPKLAKQMSSAWVQVRQNGELPKNVPDYVVKASDPRYQVFGPIIMGNFEQKTKEQLVDFILKNKVYGYEAEKTKKETIDNETVFAFPINLEVSYLKVASQSAAVSMGLEPSDTQLAVDAMESLRGASVTLYVRASDHTFARMYISKDGAAKTIDLSGYKDTKVPAAPQTKLMWSGFALLQNQVESQADLTKVQY